MNFVDRIGLKNNNNQNPPFVCVAFNYSGCNDFSHGAEQCRGSNI
jgi:hypothetical protein